MINVFILEISVVITAHHFLVRTKTRFCSVKSFQIERKNKKDTDVEVLASMIYIYICVFIACEKHQYQMLLLYFDQISQNGWNVYFHKKSNKSHLKLILSQLPQMNMVNELPEDLECLFHI